ncbi:hypothetical protein BDQ17DRAFT_1374509 [Cyathus striatus]|nr:hypothetical protein BDQ17DRAFT_1374509 [Cyathus striatus]
MIHLTTCSTGMDSGVLLFDAVLDLPGKVSPTQSLEPEAVYADIISEQGSKKRRCWTEAEDEALRTAVRLEHPDGRSPTKWLEISRHVPGRTNKDCRKRWHNHMACPRTAKGGWTAEEDALLLAAVKEHGTKWPTVADIVGTRKSCQCARRWYDTLNPKIDKTPWTTEEDVQLVKAVNKHGKRWSYISKSYFPRRTGLAAKNRFFSIVTSSMRRLRSDPIRSDKLEENEGWIFTQDLRTSSNDQLASPTHPFTYDTDSSSSSPSSPSLTTRSTSSPTSDISLHGDSYPFNIDCRFEDAFKVFAPELSYRNVNVTVSPTHCVHHSFHSLLPHASTSFQGLQDKHLISQSCDHWGNGDSNFNFHTCS